MNDRAHMGNYFTDSSHPQIIIKIRLTDRESEQIGKIKEDPLKIEG